MENRNLDLFSDLEDEDEDEDVEDANLAELYAEDLHSKD